MTSGGSSTATPSTSPSDSRYTRPIGSADPSREWAQSMRSSHPDTPVAKIADELRTQSAHVARIDGAISGTPFFIALVPGYLTYLQQEMRMTLRTAALYGREPAGAAHFGGNARAARRAPRRRRRRGCAEVGPGTGDPRSSRTPAIVAHMGSQRLPAAHRRRLHVPLGRQGRQRHAWQGPGGVRCPTGRGDLADDVGAPPHVHDHDGLGMRNARTPARPQNAPVLRRRGRTASSKRSRLPTSKATTVTTNGRSRGAPRCSSPS